MKYQIIGRNILYLDQDNGNTEIKANEHRVYPLDWFVFCSRINVPYGIISGNLREAIQIQ
jgi:hypothetical protein